ncbi:MAG TPA: IS30 family transposase [Nocardioidaceae bacterium]|nr:IS30 family transposase [Nocardioidaceae bacterium]
MVRAGVSPGDASARLGFGSRAGYRWLAQSGGMPTMNLAMPEGKPAKLTIAEREEILAGMSRDESARSIGRRIGRHHTTVAREINRNLHHQKYPRGSNKRGRVSQRPWSYSPHRAQLRADRHARRPKPAKLATNLRLRREVQTRLKRNNSPEQIANRLREDFPDDPEMWVSHETIYQSLYVQSRGALKRELTRHLRTGRALRKPQRKDGERRGRIPDMVPISERPAEVADRAVPGHWEGDLILGSTASGSAIGTLVERTTRFVMLLHLPGDHTAETVAEAMITKMTELPEQLRRSLTWDQGVEMSQHVRIAEATQLQIYFCDPHSPWQRGTNENTNGLLRQYFPKGSDLSQWGPGYLDYVAAELNARPRKTLNWRTPAEALEALLSKPSDPPGGALTA